MNISTLEHYVEQKNAIRRIFDKNARELSLLVSEDRHRIAQSLAGDLSPENLTCDGELSHTEVMSRHRYLMRVVDELKSIDYTIDVEIY